MCEHCGDPSLEWEAWLEVEQRDGLEARRRGDVTVCEFTEQPPDDEMNEQEAITWYEKHSCPRAATWVNRSTWPLDHLCEEHKTHEEEWLVQEHGEVPDPVGLGDTDRFLPIKQEEPCEAMEGQRLCAKPSSWVMIGTIDMYYCDDHRVDDE